MSRISMSTELFRGHDDHHDYTTRYKASASPEEQFSHRWRLDPSNAGGPYAGYSTSEWPSNLTAAQFAEKAGLFMAYDRARVLVNPAWSAYAELPAGVFVLSLPHLRTARGFHGPFAVGSTSFRTSNDRPSRYRQGYVQTRTRS